MVNAPLCEPGGRKRAGLSRHEAANETIYLLLFTIAMPALGL
jgi:hypothetical protein